VTISKNDPDTRVGKARQHFFIPVDESVFFEKLDEAIEQADSRFKDIAKSFRRNLEAVILTVSVPFHLTVAGAQRLRFQQIHIAERIRSRKLVDEGATEEEANQKALSKATDRFSQEQQLEENIQQLSSQVLESLEANLREEEFSRASSELLRQGTASVWSAFEVLVQDLVTTLLNARPDVAIALLTHEHTKSLFQLKALPVDTLAAYNFNVSESLGSILIRHRSVDTVPVMKAVFGVLLPEAEKLRNILDQRDLWILNQRRHLLVHRRGVVDAAYLEKTGEIIFLGDELIIRPSDLEQYLTVVCKAGIELVNETTKHY
jgi:hypothetical protein